MQTFAPISKISQNLIKINHDKMTQNLQNLAQFFFSRLLALFFIVRCGFRALGARRGWIRLSMRGEISMRWVPSERSIKAEKNVFFLDPARPGPISNKHALRNKHAMGASGARNPISVIERFKKSASTSSRKPRRAKETDSS